MGAQFAKPTEPLQPAALGVAVEPEKPKAPIPEQHIHLKTVFDELKNQCYENAKNPVSRIVLFITVQLDYTEDNRTFLIFPAN